MAGFDNDNVYFGGIDTRGVKPVVNQMTTDGQLLIGSTATPHIKVGTLTSSDSSVTVTPGSGTISLTVAGGTSVGKTITGDTGGALSPTAGNWNIVGTTTQGITSSGAGSTLTFTNADATTAQKGVLTLATNAEAIAGTDTAKAITADDLKAKLGTQTNHGFAFGTGTTTALAWTAEPSNGQLPIGSTGNQPVLATLTAGTGVSISNGAGTITINAVGGGMTWQNISASQTLAVNDGYQCTGGGALALLLPATSVIGDVIEITLDGSTSWTVTQGAGQAIRYGNVVTTGGAGGSLASTAAGDTIRIVCSVQNLRWNVLSSIGNLTVV